MTPSLVERLREPHYLSDEAKARLPEEVSDLIVLFRAERREAADALEALTRERDEARGALQPTHKSKASEYVSRERYDGVYEESRKHQARADAAEAKLLTIQGEHASQAARIAELEEALYQASIHLEEWPGGDDASQIEKAHRIAAEIDVLLAARLSLPDVEGEK